MIAADSAHRKHTYESKHARANESTGVRAHGCEQAHESAQMSAHTPSSVPMKTHFR